MTSAVLAMLVPLITALLITSGDACAGVRSMTWNETCLAACPTPALFNLCQETLLHEPEAGEAEVTVYAMAAARRVARSYDDTVDAAERMILNGTEERVAYQRCIESYGAARTEMGGVAADMASCDFARTRREYSFAAASVAACADLLKAGSPLVSRNAADRDLTKLAADLGALILDRSKFS